MGHVLTIRRPPRGVRATIIVIVAFFVLGLSLLVGPVRADTAGQLKSAEARLNALISSISSASSQLDALQGELNVLAGKITENQAAIERTQGAIVEAQQAIAALARDIQSQQGVLDQRAAIAYESGPASNLEFFLGAGSLADLQDRIEIVNAAAQSDADLITGMEEKRNQLHVKQVNLQQLQDQLTQRQASLKNQQDALNAKFATQKNLLAQLASDKASAESLVHNLKVKRQREIEAQRLAAAQARFGGNGGGGSISGVLFRCPVSGPHGYSDSFGAPRYGGGYHPHAGNDIMAALGTPIVAPFNGVASDASNPLGGLSVIVTGANGYVYNAHMSEIKQLGAVSAGTVIGLVGNSGDAQGGPYHDHFEWHPNVIPKHLWKSPYGYTIIGTAIDPYPYLNSVC
jgi:peptidoglycan hydrolase CwlO-like protein